MKHSLLILRLSLALVFLWFGFLKLFNVSPVFDIIANSYPFVTQFPILYTLLAIAEVVIGIGFLWKKFLKPTCWVAIVHLGFATLGVLLSPQAFTNTFPLLSITGEFVVKNLVLVAGAYVLVSSE